MMNSGIDSVRVAIRIRPLVDSELDKGFQSIVEKIPGEPQILVKNHEAFTFNYVFSPEITQEELYNNAVKNTVDQLFKGYNVTILAYGQTGSGKTHTMGTAFDGKFDINSGVIPRAMNDIFSKIENISEYSFNVTCSFMELYQEQLYDLLSISSREQSIVDIREDIHKGIHIPGLTEKVVTSAKEATEYLMKGSAGRAVGATAMNTQSSRSHAIFTVNIQIINTENPNNSTSSKFHLVDLAGSERSKKTKATGDRFKEGVKINQGLLALGNVISALGTGQGSGGFVGYRDSKLTRLLQDSLGGNSVTLMIACIGPADYNMDETISTLRYADRARKIKNKPIVNQDPKTAEINRLNSIIQKLRLELFTAGVNGSEIVQTSAEVKQMKKTIDNLNEKNRILQQQLQTTLNDMTDIEMRALTAETAYDELSQKNTEMKEHINWIYDNKSKDMISADIYQKITELKNLTDKVSGTIEKNKEEFLKHKESISSFSNQSEINSLPETEAVQLKIDAHTLKQLECNNKLRQLDRELIIKEQYHQRVFRNYVALENLETENCEEKTKNFEVMIKNLEEEKKDLCEKLKCKENPSVKIAEDRRKRLQQLEHEISELRKKNIQQSKLLKIREKESQKVINLHKEIQEMKAAKVKLIRAMKAENENFRQWKFNREKELAQLREKDRKRQNEMTRMETLHTKQKNVLKRKVEEAMSVNKRLKEALDKQKIAQSQKKDNNACKFIQLISWIERELEVIVSVIDAENSLEQLIEDRANLISKIKNLQESDTENATSMISCKEELQMRNEQINDLQQKIIASDIGTKINTICDSIQSMPEARVALKHLFTTLTDMRREFIGKINKLEDYKTSFESGEERITALENELIKSQRKYKEAVSNVEKNYEEKITVLLRKLNTTPHMAGERTPEMDEYLKIQQEALDKIELMREELENYKKECNILKNKRNNKSRAQNIILIDSFNDTDGDIEEDDSINDPDWVKTPVLKKRSANVSNDKSKESISECHTVNNDFFKCNCKKDCSSKLCSCRKHSSNCNDKCFCTGKCTNNSLNEIKENIAMQSMLHTPKKSSPELFDVTTPAYPFSTKKRKPFFE